MIDKETQLDFSENIQEVIYKAYKELNVRKVSVPVMPTSFIFNLEETEQRPRSRYSRCSSKREIRPVIKRNNSEFKIRPKIEKVASFANFTFMYDPIPKLNNKKKKSSINY